MPNDRAFALHDSYVLAWKSLVQLVQHMKRTQTYNLLVCRKRWQEADQHNNDIDIFFLSFSSSQMASEEERAKIMAEYLAGTDDAEEEDEFQEEDDEEEDSSSNNYPLLQGRLKLNEEQHLIYLGTWQMKNSSAASSNTEKQKFKMKSTIPLPKMDLQRPFQNKFKMNGFFYTEKQEKIKEMGVTMEFHKESSNKYNLTGLGENSLGTFKLKGIYTPKKDEYWLQCSKQYYVIDDDDDDDSIIPEDSEGEDPQELNELQQDANLSVEALRQKYYSGTKEDDDNDTKPPPTKKQKVIPPTADDEEDDDDCGF